MPAAWFFMMRMYVNWRLISLHCPLEIYLTEDQRLNLSKDLSSKILMFSICLVPLLFGYELTVQHCCKDREYHPRGVYIELSLVRQIIRLWAI